jgi:hypothetical protein
MKKAAQAAFLFGFRHGIGPPNLLQSVRPRGNRPLLQESGMTPRLLAPIVLVALSSFGVTQAMADTLLVDRVKAERNLAAPRRGMTMTQVERQFGAPSDKMAPAGGDTALHPTINRWVYPNYIVYFERNHVINSVAQRATPNEIGPKGAVQQQ